MALAASVAGVSIKVVKGLREREDLRAACHGARLSKPGSWYAAHPRRPPHPLPTGSERARP